MSLDLAKGFFVGLFLVSNAFAQPEKMAPESDDSVFVKKLSSPDLGDLAKWKAELLDLVKKSPMHSVSAIPGFITPNGLSKTETAGLKKVYDVFSVFRTGSSENVPNAKSKWFRDLRLPEVIDVAHTLLSKACEEKDPLKEILNAGDTDLAAEVSKSEPEKVPARTAGGALALKMLSDPSELKEWRAKWSTQSAIQFVRYLYTNSIYLAEADLGVVGRQASGLVKPAGKMNVMPKIEYLVIHHTATGEDLNLKNVQRDHMNRLVSSNDPSKGTWSDIGPHYFVMKDKTSPDWQIFAARDPWYRGAHAPPKVEGGPGNPNSIGIETAGLYRDGAPPPEALLKVYSLIQAFSKKDSQLNKGIEATEREGARTRVEIKGIVGHLECSREGHTECPGAGYLPIIQEWNRLLFPAGATLKQKEGSK